MKVPLVDLKEQYSELKKEIDSAILRVSKSGWYLLGNELLKFEADLSKYIGTKYAVGVHSGTDALTIGIKALGLGKGDGVVVPANVYPTAFGVALSGVDIELADVDHKSLNISVETIRKAVTKKTRAVVAVHLYGNPAQITEIKKFCKSRGLFLIEDCAQAIGAMYKNHVVGSIGDISCFSFYPTKNLGAYGDGGAVLTSNKKLAEKVKKLRMYGESKRYDSEFVGHNSRLDEIQSAILSVKIKHIHKENEKRRKIAAKYKKNLQSLPIRFIEEADGGRSVYHLFVIQTSKRNQLSEYLSKNGIANAIHYPVTIHQTRAFSYLGYTKGKFPVAEISSKQVVSIPMYPQISEESIKFITSKINEFFK